MEQSNKNYIIAVNKIDKVNQKSQNALRNHLESALDPTVKIFYYSAHKGKNVHLLQDYLLEAPSEE